MRDEKKEMCNFNTKHNIKMQHVILMNFVETYSYGFRIYKLRLQSFKNNL